jgi:hypothetical protein
VGHWYHCVSGIIFMISDTDSARYTLAVGKPPFHATTREEIYKKLQKRDYKWPDYSSSSKNSNQNISHHLQSLVSSLLVDEDNRPSPDDIVCHPFFRWAYVPEQLSSLCTQTEPIFPNCSSSSRDQAILKSMMVDEYHRNWHALCAESGVGVDPHSAYYPGVGLASGKSVFRDLEKEIKANRAPTVPIASDRVYLPFDLTVEGKLAETDGKKSNKNRVEKKTGPIASLSDISEEKDSSSSAAPSTIVSVKSRLVEISGNDRMLPSGGSRARTLGISTASASRRNLAASKPTRYRAAETIKAVLPKENSAPVESERPAPIALGRSRSVKERAERYEQLGGVARFDGPSAYAQPVQSYQAKILSETPKDFRTTRVAAPGIIEAWRREEEENKRGQAGSSSDKPAVFEDAVERPKNDTRSQRPQRIVGVEIQGLARTRSARETTRQQQDKATDVLVVGEIRSQRLGRSERPRRVPTPPAAPETEAIPMDMDATASKKAAPEKRKRVITPQVPETHEVVAVPRPIRPTTRSASGSSQRGQKPGAEHKDTAGSTKVEVLLEAGTIRRRQAAPTAVSERSDRDAKSRSVSAASTTSSSSGKSAQNATDLAILPNTDPAVALHHIRELQIRLLYTLQGKEVPSSKLKGSSVEHHILSSSGEASLPFVTGWVDWTTKHGIAYVLDNGTVGTISSSSATSTGGVTYVIVKDGISQVQKMVASVSGLKNAKEALSAVRCNCDYRFWTEASTTGQISDASKSLSREQREGGVAMWNKCVKYMYKSNQETWATAQDATKEKPDRDEMVILRYYQRLGTVGVFGFSNGCFQVSFSLVFKSLADMTVQFP